MPFDPLPYIPSAVLPVRAIAHAQPPNWTSYEQGDTRYYQGTEAQGVLSTLIIRKSGL
jgi:hypothetical protein